MLQKGRRETFAERTDLTARKANLIRHKKSKHPSDKSENKETVPYSS